MKVVFHDDFYQQYTSDPAAAAGRIESIMAAIENEVTFVTAQPASESVIGAVHPDGHIARIKQLGVHAIAALAAGGALQAAEIGLTEPAFALIRPPGHHASAESCWGFCFYSNMAIALTALKQAGRIQTAAVLDIDMHFGDGTENILGSKDWVAVHNFESMDRVRYMEEVEDVLTDCRVDMIGISAGFDNHREDWGGVLDTDDYTAIGRMVKETAKGNDGGCFAILEGGYNHDVLGVNARALISGLGD